MSSYYFYANIKNMNADNITDIILSIISIIVPLATLFVSVRTNANSNSNHKKQTTTNNNTQEAVDRLRDEIKQENQRIIDRLARNDLQTCRIDFRQALHDSPDNIPACLEIARIYFLNMGGNADMGRKFLAWVKKYKVQEWADEHGEDISNLIEAATHSA